MTSNQFGDATLIQTTSTLFYPILTLLLADSILRFCFLKEYNPKEILSIGLRGVVVAFIISLIITIFYFFFITDNIFKNNVFFIPAIILAYSLSRVLHSFCRGIDKVKISAFSGLIQTIIVVTLNLLFLLLFKWGVFGYLLAFLMGECFASLYMSIKLKIKNYITFYFNRNLLKEMLQFSVPLIPNQMSWWLIGNMNQYIILIFINMSAVGIYSATLRISTILTALSDIFAQAWLLSALRGYGTNESKIFINKMYMNYFVFINILTSFFILLSYPLSKLLLKGNFIEYWYINPFLFISVLLGALTGFFGSIFSAEKKTKIQAVSTIIGGIVTPLISFLLIRQWGIIAVAIGTLFGNFVITLIRAIRVKKYMKLSKGINILIWYIGILIIESILTMYELYYFAIFIPIVLILLNWQTSKTIIIQLTNIVKEYSNKIIRLR